MNDLGDTKNTRLYRVYLTASKQEMEPEMRMFWDAFFDMTNQEQAILDGVVYALVDAVKGEGAKAFGPLQAFELVGKLGLFQVCEREREPNRSLWLNLIRHPVKV